MTVGTVINGGRGISSFIYLTPKEAGGGASASVPSGVLPQHSHF